MHLHEIVKIDAAAFSAVHSAVIIYPSDMDRAMKRKPSTEATAAWIRLMRVQSRVLDAVEQDLKKAGFPPLAWYDALLELSRAPSGELRPVELERQMLIPQYSTSRLIDRLVDSDGIRTDQASNLYFDAFSSREPVSTSLENAIR